MKKISILFMGLLLAGVLTGCANRYETKMVEGTVIEKEYEPAKTTYKTTKVNGKTKKKTVKESEEWDVTVQYKEITKEFELSDDDLFERVEEGDQIKVNLVQGFSKDNKIVSEDIELIEEK